MSVHRLLALVSVLLLAACSSRDKRSESTLQLAEIVKVYQGGAAKEAAERLQAFVKTDPNDERAWLLLGNALLDLDKLDEAEAAYAKALQIDPRRAAAFIGQGIIFRKRGEYDKALAVYEKALAIEPSNPNALSSIASVAIKQGDFDKAVTYGEKAYAKDKTSPIIASNLAVAYHYAGNPKKRDQLVQAAERLGYKDMDNLRKICAGELDIRE